MRCSSSAVCVFFLYLYTEGKAESGPSREASSETPVEPSGIAVECMLLLYTEYRVQKNKAQNISDKGPVRGRRHRYEKAINPFREEERARTNY